MPRIRDVLVDLNPWWKGNFTVDYKDRRIYGEIRKFLAQPQVLALTGLRRVGKTTLMLKLIEDRIREGTDPKRVAYFSFDELRDVELREILDEYSTLVGTDVGEGGHLLFLDEVQKLEGWGHQLKALYDRHRGRLRIVISGSESLFIRRKSRETLAGRLFEFRVDPLSFREYLGFRGVRYEPLGLHERELERWFEEFLLTQGFPELVGVRDKAVLKKYVHESVIDRIVFRDLPMLLNVRDVSTLRSLLNILMEEPGQMIRLADLAGELAVSRQTLSNYLTYFEEAFLLRKLYNFSTGRRKVERKLKKYYPTVLSVDLLFRDDDLARSKVLEWAVVNQLRAEFFWRDPYKNEVDVVVPDGAPTPIEVKYGRIDIAGLRAFMRRFGVTKGYVVTRRAEETRKDDGRTIVVVPAYKHLLVDDVRA
jgi:predicted AAA+ superfamily ATPase